MSLDHKDGIHWLRGYRFLSSKFYEKTETMRNAIISIEHIKLDCFCRLFPNLKRIFIQNIYLSDAFMERMLEFLGMSSHKVEEINVYNIGRTKVEDELTMEEYVQKYWQAFDDINFK